MKSEIIPKCSPIAVALSGGVDSAVVAALLKQQGHNVFAVTLLLQEHDAVEEATAVAETLGIEHFIVDASAQFSRQVVEPFADSYLKGETPVPCVGCNKHIKFGALFDFAREKGADFVATGHYVRRVLGPNGRVELHRGQDPMRDQSYFLSALSQDQLDFSLFPLAEMSKSQTRSLAMYFGLPVADKKDSQDICFVPCGDYVSVVEKLKLGAQRPGNIVDEQGKILGVHQGIIHFTVGQRKGLNLSDRKGDNNAPLFVLALDAQKNQVIVGPRESLMKETVQLKELNWLGEPVPEQGMVLTARLRSAQQPMPARLLAGKEGTVLLQLDTPSFGVAKGQRAALYQGTRLLGGGWITGAV